MMVSEHWFRLWLSDAKQHAINWSNVNRGLCRLMATQGHKDLTSSQQNGTKTADNNFKCNFVNKNFVNYYILSLKSVP